MTATEGITGAVAAVVGKKLEILHLGFSVKSIPETVDFFVKTFGAGPFFEIPHIEFDELEYESPTPVIWEHSAAFGAWDGVVVELQQMDRVEPADLEAKIAGPTNRLNHVAYLADNSEEESARLEKLGMPRYLRLKTGPIESIFHDAPMLGVSLEIHKDTEFIRGGHAMFKGAAVGWNGSDQLRPIPTDR